MINKKRFCKCWIYVGKETNTRTGNSLKVRLYPLQTDLFVNNSIKLF